jgi:hypothetical protein
MAHWANPDDFGGTSPPNPWDFMNEALAIAKKALREHQECQELFGTAETRAGEFSPERMLDQLFSPTMNPPSGNQYGSFSFADLTSIGPAAITYPVPGSAVPGLTPPTLGLRVGIVINSAQSAASNAWMRGDSFNNAVTLLHEMGHAYDWLFRSGGSKINWDPFGIGSADNDAVVIANCFTVQPTRR